MMTENCHRDGGFRRRILRESVIIFTAVVLFNDVSAFNLDLTAPIQYRSPTNNSYFGFSVAQYIDKNSQSKLLIGAPKSVDESYIRKELNYSGGAVYVCDADNSNTCHKIKFPKERNERITENRTEQWLGGTVTTSKASKGGIIMACSPRYYWIRWTRPNFSDPVGTCYFSEDGSLNFTEDGIYNPCKSVDQAGYGRLGSCQAGFSAAVSKDSKILYAGAVGSYTWKGKVFAKNIQTYREKDTRQLSINETVDPYLGYSMTSLNFRGVRMTGVAVSRPRSFNDTLHIYGQVLIYDSDLNWVKNIIGEQLGAYFGYSMCTSDVDGDGADDLIIGAPLYANSAYEIGRIYVFYQGKFKCSKIDPECGEKIFEKSDFINGDKPGARFGTALTSLGDINQDGFDDIAVSAPYELDVVNNQSSGAVYIYLGSKNGLNQNPSQIIRPSDFLNPSGKNFPLRSLGFSLFGGLDLDGNRHPDLAVGAYESDVAYLFRSRAVTHLKVNFSYLIESTEYGKIINLQMNNCQTKDNKQDTVCVTLEMCLQYDGIAVENQIEISTNITLDTKKSPARMRFELNDSHKLKGRFTLDKNKKHCEKMTVYFENLNPSMDRLTPLDAELQYELVESKNKKKLPDILNFEPRNRTDRLEILKMCGDDNNCVPDLNLSIIPNVDKVVIPFTKEFLQLHVSVQNDGEESHNSTFALTVPRGLDYFSFIDAHSDKAVSVSCNVDSSNTIICRIGNPLRGNQTVKFTINFKLASDPEIDNSVIEFSASVNSTNPEQAETMRNNRLSFKIPVFYNRILIESYTSPTISKDIYKLRFETNDDEHAGRRAVHQYNIRNLVSSTITKMSVMFYWPANLTTGEDLLYLVKQPMTEGTIECGLVPNVNYRHLNVNRIYKKVYNYSDDLGSQTSKDQETTSEMPQRRLRSTSDDLYHESDTTTCYNGTCFLKIPCNVYNLSENEEVSVVFPSIVWAETIKKLGKDRTEPVRIRSHVEVNSIKLARNRIPATNETYTSEAFTTIEPQQPDIPIWIIVGSLFLGILILMLIVYSLYKYGFFKRNRPPLEMSQQHALCADDLKRDDEDWQHNTQFSTITFTTDS